MNLSAPVLELVLKLKTGTIQPSIDVRPVVEDLLAQLERGAASAGCDVEQRRDLKFALVAFLDETILSPANDFPLRTDWEQNPLQLAHFNEHLAGVKFFEKLELMLGDAEANLDVIEVYYFCLLLGYKGKYNVYFLEEQLKDITKKVADLLRDSGRLRPTHLSPHWRQTDQPEPPAPRRVPTWVKIAAPSAAFLLLAVYLILYRILAGDAAAVR